MAWIESHTVLVRHRKLNNLAKDLRLKPVYVLGHLHALWHAALEQQEDGDLTSWSDELIAQLSCYSGDAPRYVSLLQQNGWLDNKIIHDWLDYAGRYLEAKYRTANPTLLTEIRSKHKPDSLTKVRPPNQPNLTNQKIGVTFVPPTPQEVKSFCLERKNKVDPDKFHDFYAAKGWMVGKNKMKDWRAAVRTWEKTSEFEEVKKPLVQDHNKRFEETQRYLKSLENGEL